MPSISGISGFAALVVNNGDLVGTRKGVHVEVKTSFSSPDEHWASETPGSGVKPPAITGAATAATMNPPVRSSRRIADGVFAIARVYSGGPEILGLSGDGTNVSSYGLELTLECGTAIGPSACCSSPRPMHSPELPPVHGMPSTAGSEGLPGIDSFPDIGEGEFGTRSGVHDPV
jgi:hypothetical protein